MTFLAPLPIWRSGTDDPLSIKISPSKLTKARKRNIGTQRVQELFFSCEVGEIMELFTVIIWLILSNSFGYDVE